MFHASEFIEHGKQLGLDLYTGVPCSFLKPLINYVIDGSEDVRYVPLNNEGESIAFACGSYLAGKHPVVMFQNSGVGNTVNPITSLAYPFRIPLLLISTWRGQPGIQDEPQHELMGQITSELFSLMQVRSEVLPADAPAMRAVLERATTCSRQAQLPYALIMPKGVVESYPLRKEPEVARAPGEKPGEYEEGPATMRRYDAIKQVCALTGPEHVIVATTGKTGRELYAYRDSPNHLYVVGSMGCASTLGLGLALNLREQKKVVVLDGDGAALMRMEAIASIGHFQPDNLIHIVLDNNAHDSTGGQRTLSHTVAFHCVAAACGYHHSESVQSLWRFEKALERALTANVASFIHVRIRSGSPPDLPRPAIKPHEVKERLMSFLGTRSSDG